MHTQTLSSASIYSSHTNNVTDRFNMYDADFGDFDNTTMQITFLPDEDSPINEHMVPITVVDDDTDEATEQIFIVTLKHVESIRENSVNLETRNSSLCRIIDNDSKYTLNSHASLIKTIPLSGIVCFFPHRHSYWL